MPYLGLGNRCSIHLSYRRTNTWLLYHRVLRSASFWLSRRLSKETEIVKIICSSCDLQISIVNEKPL
jgi:hypothetical protein